MSEVDDLMMLFSEGEEDRFFMDCMKLQSPTPLGSPMVDGWLQGDGQDYEKPSFDHFPDLDEGLPSIPSPTDGPWPNPPALADTMEDSSITSTLESYEGYHAADQRASEIVLPMATSPQSQASCSEGAPAASPSAEIASITTKDIKSEATPKETTSHALPNINTPQPSSAQPVPSWMVAAVCLMNGMNAGPGGIHSMKPGTLLPAVPQPSSHAVKDISTSPSSSANSDSESNKSWSASSSHTASKASPGKTQKKKLTAEERMERNRQRLIRNREAANRARARKKAQMERLESENGELSSQLEETTKEVEKLKAQLRAKDEQLKFAVSLVQRSVQATPGTIARRKAPESDEWMEEMEEGGPRKRVRTERPVATDSSGIAADGSIMQPKLTAAHRSYSDRTSRRSRKRSSGQMGTVLLAVTFTVIASLFLQLFGDGTPVMASPASEGSVGLWQRLVMVFSGESPVADTSLPHTSGRVLFNTGSVAGPHTGVYPSVAEGLPIFSICLLAGVFLVLFTRKLSRRIFTKA